MRRLCFIALAIVLLFSWSCSREDKLINSPLSESEVKTLSSAEKIEDIFLKVSETQLELTADSAISVISDIAKDSKGNFIIADGWKLNHVWIFSPDGHFLQKLGQQGQGPGEYNTPERVAINSEGEILVSDYLRGRIIFYDRDYRYEREILVKARMYRSVHVNNKNEIYMYEGMIGPMVHEVFDTIQKLNDDGDVILTFAPIPKKALKIRYSVAGDGMTIDKNDFIFEMNPLYYQIRKYTADGKLIKSFANPNFRNARKKSERPLVLNGPYYLEKGVLIVQREDRIDIFDTEGNFIVDEIPLPQKIIYAQGNTIYLEQWEEPESQKQQLNPKIICYDLKICSSEDTNPPFFKVDKEGTILLVIKRSTMTAVQEIIGQSKAWEEIRPFVLQTSHTVGLPSIGAENFFHKLTK
ncbi:MAG: 6-bladed beta-propeller [Candidatus Aminicenantes bacterium]|nr:6-bladed beta-propeller [Candidatus Aminicenantes bacterium]MDH5706486.1 6-bladed beta-propeller [Candidatus Aminicenantes bacterium]